MLLREYSNVYIIISVVKNHVKLNMKDLIINIATSYYSYSYSSGAYLS